MNPSIVFTGGGTAGHVTPNIALIQELKKEGFGMAYIGSNEGIEKAMISDLGIPFYGVSSGKLRRYFSLKNLMEPFKVIKGIVQSALLLHKLKPQLVFSKGGFVAFPVVFGAWLNKIPIVAHESDLTPGLANKLSYPFVNTICLPFEASKKYFKKQDKIAVTGTPIRQQLFEGDPSKALELCNFDTSKPCLLVIGGSLGAQSINQTLRQALGSLLANFQIIHICGKGKIDQSLLEVKGYKQFEYAKEELADFFAAASLVVSRSGANSLYEILALGKPHVLIPLSARVSRGDQIHNSAYFQKAGISTVIQDEALNAESLIAAIEAVMSNKDEIKNKINQLEMRSASKQIVDIIKLRMDLV